MISIWPTRLGLKNSIFPIEEHEMNRLDEIFSDNHKPADFAKSYGAYLGEVLDNLDYAEVGKMIDAILEAREKGSQIFFIGNGGSAATASHFANDLSIG